MAFGVNIGGMSMLAVGIAAAVFLTLVGLFGWIIFNNMYKYKVLIYQETGTGGYFVWSKAKIYAEDNVKKMRIWKFREHDLPPPTLDTVVPFGSGGEVILRWRDINGNIHPARWSRISPVFVEDNNELVQLEEEVRNVASVEVRPVEEVKKRGWFSNALNRFVRQAKVKAPTGEVIKKYVAINEVIFEPDNRSARVFMAQALRRNHEKHQFLAWYMQPWFLGVTSVAMCVLALLITGYFIADIWTANIDKAASVGTAISQASDKLGNALLVAGGG